jgi:uncharacterized membrane protein
VKANDPSGAARKRATALHDGFEIGILLKGIHGALEIVGGALLLLVKPELLTHFVRLLTQHELSADPNDLLANLILQASQRYSVSVQHFGVAYLLTHGLVKVVLVLLLWKRRLWAYPLAAASLVLFIAYQAARWTTTHSIFLVLLSVFDAAMIWLTLVEYHRLRCDPWRRCRDEP